MSIPIDKDEIQGKFERNVNTYIGKEIMHHIPMDLKRVGDFHKKVEKMMPIKKFKNYFHKIVYGVHKVVVSDSSNMMYVSI